MRPHHHPQYATDVRPAVRDKFNVHRLVADAQLPPHYHQ